MSLWNKVARWFSEKEAEYLPQQNQLVVQEDFIVIVVSTGLTMNETNHPGIMALIEVNPPSFLQFLNPEAYVAYFRKNDTECCNHAERLFLAIQNLIENDKRFVDFSVSAKEGTLIAELDRSGKLISFPIGLAVHPRTSPTNW